MILQEWNDLPEKMKTEEVRKYYDILKKKKKSLVLKRAFDIIVSSILLILFSPIFLVLAVAIKLDSPGPVFFRQTRVTQYGKEFKIFKFRTMVSNAEKIGAQITGMNDARITKVGNVIRKYRLDEFSQLIDVFRGTMTFVGTRPEVPKYVEQYTPEMMATLLLPAGVTSKASIKFKDEDVLLSGAEDIDKTYVETVLPQKMKYNLQALEKFNILTDLITMIETVLAVIR